MTENTTTPAGDMNVFSRMLGVFTSPTGTFKAISVKPAWFAAIIAVIVLTIAMSIITKPVQDKEGLIKQQEIFEKRGMDQEQIDKITEQMQGKAKLFEIIKYVSIIVSTFVVFCIISLIWWFISKFILGGETNFSQMMGLNAYAGLIPALGMLIKAPIILSRETMNVHFSIASFMSDSLKDTFLYKFLSQIELFNIWSAVVFCIGLAIFLNKDVKKVAPVVVIAYLLWFVVSAGLQKLFGF